RALNSRRSQFWLRWFCARQTSSAPGVRIPQVRRSGVNRRLCGEVGLLPGPYLDPDRRAQEAEGTADLVFQKTLIRKVQLHLAIGEEDERRRGHSGLCEVENLHALAYGN